MDKKNRKLLQNILEETETKDSSGINIIKNATTTKGKARAFYHSCIHDSEEQNKENIQDLINLITDSGGCLFESLKQDMNDNISFDERVQWMHFKYGLNAFFTWGVIDVEKGRRLAIISGGFNQGLADDDFNKQQYLNIMTRIINLLSEAQENEIIVDLDYNDVISDSLNETRVENSSTTLINVTYEYEDIDDEYNPSYDYKDSLSQNDYIDSPDYKVKTPSFTNENRLPNSNIGTTLIDFFKKPIEWIIASTVKNQSIDKTENGELLESRILSNNTQNSPTSQNSQEKNERDFQDENNISSKTNIEKPFKNNYQTKQTAALIRNNAKMHSL